MKYPTSYRTEQIDGLSIFYREAGPKDAPTLLLLHGLPSSSRMFEPLFARLSDHYHLVAPDYPGFGHSDWPDPKQFAYTFDHYRRHHESVYPSARALALHTLHAGLWRAGGFPHGPGAPGARGSSHRPGRGRHNEGLGRTGRRAASFGRIALPMRDALRKNLLSLATTSPAMSETIPTWSAMTRISGPTNLFSQSARPGRDSKRSLLRLPHQRRFLSEMAGMDAREAAAPAGDLGQIRIIV